MTAESRVIVSSWPLVGWWWITGGHERGWHRHRLIGAALVEATTGAAQKSSTTRYVTGLRIEVGRAELCEGGYYVCELDAWPACQCERPRTSDHDPRFCHRCACVVPAPAPRPATVTTRSAARSAVDQWIAERQEDGRG